MILSSNVSDIKSSLCSKNAEISELKIQIDDLKGVIKREDKSREELQSVYQRRLREKQAEVDSYKRYSVSVLLLLILYILLFISHKMALPI